MGSTADTTPPPKPGWAAQCEMLIRLGYDKGEAAKFFQMSGRNLSRKLGGEGVKWIELVNKVEGGDSPTDGKKKKGANPGPATGDGKASSPASDVPDELTEEYVEEKILFLLSTADDPRVLDSAIGKAIAFLEKKKKLSTGDLDDLGFTPDEIFILSEGYRTPGDGPA